MTLPPLVTAMMLVRDRADLLGDAAASVLAQSERNLELVIFDDGSTDDTWQVAQRLAASDDRVVLLRSEHSLGIPAARNRVLAAARGRYVAICDSDDLSRPDRFAASLAAFRADDQLVGVGGRVSAFEDDPVRGTVPDWYWGLRGGRLPFAFPGAMLRTDAMRSVGGFDERYSVCEDLHLCYRLAGWARRRPPTKPHAASLADDRRPDARPYSLAEGRRGHAPFRMLDEVLVDYRVHAGSITARRPWHHQYLRLRAQLRGLRELRGRFAPRGYAVLCQTTLRLLRDAARRS